MTTEFNHGDRVRVISDETGTGIPQGSEGVVFQGDEDGWMKLLAMLAPADAVFVEFPENLTTRDVASLQLFYPEELEKVIINDKLLKDQLVAFEMDGAGLFGDATISILGVSNRFFHLETMDNHGQRTAPALDPDQLRLLGTALLEASDLAKQAA